MKLITVLKRAHTASFVKLVGLVLRYPHFVWPTYRATKACMALATQYYGREHYKNGPANAFRHALWNCLIADKCTHWSKNEVKVLLWTKKITDWHEEAFFSRSLAMTMDLHNNALGRYLYKQKGINTQAAYVKLLLDKTAKAVKIDQYTVLKPLINQLVYISEQ